MVERKIAAVTPRHRRVNAPPRRIFQAARRERLSNRRRGVATTFCDGGVAAARRILLAVLDLSALMPPRMSIAYQIVVCGSIVPDPLQTLEPVTGPALKNEMMLPAVLDPWASHALYEAANLTKNSPGSKVWLVSLGPKAKLQQVMMTVAQKVPFELVALDGPASGFTEAAEVAAALADAISAIPGLDKSKLLVFGGWESASRGAGATMQMVGERLGITDQFQGVDELKIAADGSLEILERIEGGKHQISKCAGPPALLGWATGNLPEPKNNPQVGMVNMRTVMPALQKAKPVKLAGEGLSFASVSLPKQLRETKIVKDKSADDIAKEIVEWIKQ
jgi:electron transfer flavoprotein beta subunit